MSKIILSLVFITISFFASSQSTDETIYAETEVDSVAHFPGTKNDWNKFLQKTLNPNVPVDNGAKPKRYDVKISFTVTKEGKLKDFKPETKHKHGMEEEVIRMMKLSPDWIPAKKNGENVNSRTTITQTFVISMG